ncbi:hypothetical protein HPB52_007840 [Rhipicephalus sanguineus]|uniref:Uncharacterized protein n=1 Tax=Rhipicephalus sanguineus TaxID=34632 RepID=A0A9D4T3I5_RHISA|nr:hypothetical protein HPB52_007840 [Rhipicephalus sanguineus]
MDYDSSNEEIVTVLMCSAMVSALLEQKPPNKRPWWVRPSLHWREVAGHASGLLPDLRSHDEEYFRDWATESCSSQAGGYAIECPYRGSGGLLAHRGNGDLSACTSSQISRRSVPIAFIRALTC